MIIRNIEPGDAPAWQSMRCNLWPGDDAGHAAEVAAFFAGRLEEPAAVLVALEDQKLVAFAELSIREDIAQLAGKRVGYVEGLYVDLAFRGRGVTRRLLTAARAWAREQSCEGFASDRADKIVVDRRF